MNAPTKKAELAQPNVELIPLTAIALSETHVQAARRKRYDLQALEDLATSIRDTGVLMPIVVRPLAALRGLAKYELVAGERRWIAAEKAGLAHIIARIVELSDEQVLKAQLVENLHREGLDPLAEAEGYHELIAGGVNADAIGAMIGRSRSYVYARVKLRDICPSVKEALGTGELDASQALLFARIPSAKLQDQALNTLRKWNYQGHGERLSFRRTTEILGDKMKGVFIPLAQVPFRLDDASFYAFGPKHGKNELQDMLNLPTCLLCPKRSGNDAELLVALQGDANVCTDKECHDAKAKQEFERRRKTAEASGKEVLSGEAAAAIAPTQFGTRGFVDLDEECDDDEFPEPEPKQGKDEADEAFEVRMGDWDQRYGNWKPRTYRQVLGADIAKLEITLVQDPKSKSRLRELAPDKEVAKLLKDKGLKARITRDTRKPEKPAKPQDPEAVRRRTEKEAREAAEAQLEEAIANEVRVRTIKAMHEKWKGPVHRDELELLAEVLLEDSGWPDEMEILYAKRVTPATMNERDLGRLLINWAVLTRSGGYRNDDRPLKAMCKRLKIETKAIEKEVRAARTPKDEASAPAKKPAKGKGKKK